jgi:hypothetical protein
MTPDQAATAAATSARATAARDPNTELKPSASLVALPRFDQTIVDGTVRSPGVAGRDGSAASGRPNAGRAEACGEGRSWCASWESEPALPRRHFPGREIEPSMVAAERNVAGSKTIEKV